jgi:Coatomer epsilon subunit
MLLPTIFQNPSLPFPFPITPPQHTTNLLSSPSQGGESYQQTHYIYEEVSSSCDPPTPSASTLVAQAVTAMHLARLPEAEAALQAALELEPQNAHAAANRVVLAALMGGSTTGNSTGSSSTGRRAAEGGEEGITASSPVEGLGQLDPGHGLFCGLEEAERRFEAGMSRFGARVVEGG